MTRPTGLDHLKSVKAFTGERPYQAGDVCPGCRAGLLIVRTSRQATNGDRHVYLACRRCGHRRRGQNVV